MLLSSSFSSSTTTTTTTTTTTIKRTTTTTTQRPRLLIINYGKLSQKTSKDYLLKLLRCFNGTLDMVVLDELHKVKICKSASSGNLIAVDADSNDLDGDEADDIDTSPSTATATATATTTATDESKEINKIRKEHLSKRRRVIEIFVAKARATCNRKNKCANT